MSPIPRRRVFALAAGAYILATLPVRASTARVAVNDDGIAIDGYDTTAYWSISAPRHGVSSHVVNWAGSDWHFTSAEDADTFAATPEAFAPQFGGFCTRALSFKKIINGDPEVWRIYQGKLYLFAQPVGGRKFDKGQDAMIAKAQAYWDTLN
jgi:hypothetical protein